MKILFVTLRALEINSSVTISNMGLLKGFVELGYDVDILMPNVNKSLMQYDNNIDFELENINIIRIGENKIYENLVINNENTYKKIITKSLRRLFYLFNIFDNTITFLNKADVSLLKNQKYDIIISTSDPKTSHIFVSKLIKQGLCYNIWVQHWGDPLLLDISRKNIYPKFYVKSKEKKIFSVADFILYVSPLTEKAQKKLFPNYSKKMYYIPLPYYKEKIYHDNYNEKICIGYFGDYNSEVRNISPLYNLCDNKNSYNLVIAGSSNLSLASKDNIKILPRCTQQQINELELNCDILVCICNKLGTQIPGKIYYYTATNKPILVILDGEYKQEIKKYLEISNRFVFCNNNMEDIKKSIDNIINNKTVYAPSNDYSAKEISKKLMDIINL
jgi:hypothetical protein